jgi:hypothetical protein
MTFWQLPAAVLLFLTWFNAPPASLADASRREAVRRQILPRAGHALTNDNLPAPRPVFSEPADAAATTAPDQADANGKPAKSDGGDKPADVHDEAYWRTRINTARDTFSHDQMTVDALQSQVNGLTTDFINRDDPAQKAQIEQQRIKVMNELNRMKTQLDADQKNIDGVMDEARRAGVPPGWLRGGGL